MKYEVKKLSNSQIQIVVEIPNQDLKPFLDKAAQKISQGMEMPGFRSGKVPYDVLKEKVGEQSIYQEAANLIVQKTYPEICQKEKFITVASPKVEIIKVAPDNPFIYKAIVPILPKVKIGDYRKFKAKKKEIKIDAEQITKVLQDLQKLRAKEIISDAPVKKGDKVEIDFSIYMDKVIIEGGQGKKVDLIVGEGYFIPGFEDQLIGLTKNQEKKFKLTFPKDYYQKNLANRDGDFEVKVLSVWQRELPELNDDFAKMVGNKFKSFADLKEQLHKNLELEEQAKENQRFEMAIVEEIITRSEFEEIPEILIEAELDKMIAELRAEIEKRKLKFDDYLASLKKTVDDLKKEFEGKAVTRLKTALITREIAKLEEIEVPDEEVAKEINKTLKLYTNNKDIKEKLSNPQYFSYLKNVITSRKVLAHLNQLASKK